MYEKEIDDYTSTPKKNKSDIIPLNVTYKEFIFNRKVKTLFGVIQHYTKNFI